LAGLFPVYPKPEAVILRRGQEPRRRIWLDGLLTARFFASLRMTNLTAGDIAYRESVIVKSKAADVRLDAFTI
jgi:hypothetical protein